MRLSTGIIWILLHILLVESSSIRSVNYVKHTINLIIRKVEGVIEETIINTECGKDLKLYVQDLIRRKKWAVQMIDASAKFGPGFLLGNVNQVGNYDQCLAVRETTTAGKEIAGQYCTIIIGPKNDTDEQIQFKGLMDPFWVTNFISSKALKFLRKHSVLMKMTYGVCLPKSCSIENFKEIWSYIDRAISLPVKVQFRDVLCDYKDKPRFHIGIEPLIFAAFLLYFSVLIVATIYEVFYFDGDESSLSSYVCTLSLRRNAQKLFSSEVGEDNISCINGIKVLSMLWVVVGHRFLVNALLPNMNSLILFEWKENIQNMAILGATVSVDTFLTISGLLLSYIYLRYTELKNVRVNMTSFYMLRICRLTPPLLAVILIYIAVFKYIGDGPLWPVISGKLAANCVKYGWTNLLYINNLINLTDQCVLQSWYLSVDSQLYFLFPLIFFSITRNPKKTLYGILIFGVVSSFAAFFATIYYEYNSSLFDFRYANNLYQNTFLRMPVWLIGVVAGYIVFKYKDKEVYIPKNMKVGLWILSFVTMNFVVFGQVILLRSDNYIFSAIFNALGRPLWAFTICWTIFACVTKNGGGVNSFLSLPVFNVIAKLTYSLYLIHMVVILMVAGRRRHIDHFNNIRAIHEFCGDAIFSLVVGICFSLLFESPVITFAKKLFRRIEENSENDSTDPLLAIIRYRMWFVPVKIQTHTKKE